MAARHAASPIFDEISMTGDSMEAVTFHDQSAQMTVVWLQDNNPSAAEQQNHKPDVPAQDQGDSEMDLE
jgi:hypothetical protein